jgi:hypothetical protein
MPPSHADEGHDENRLVIGDGLEVSRPKMNFSQGQDWKTWLTRSKCLLDAKRQAASCCWRAVAPDAWRWLVILHGHAWRGPAGHVVVHRLSSTPSAGCSLRAAGCREGAAGASSAVATFVISAVAVLVAFLRRRRPSCRYASSRSCTSCRGWAHMLRMELIKILVVAVA